MNELEWRANAARFSKNRSYTEHPSGVLETQLVNQIGSIVFDTVNGGSSKRPLTSSAIWNTSVLFLFVHEFSEVCVYLEQTNLNCNKRASVFKGQTELISYWNQPINLRQFHYLEKKKWGGEKRNSVKCNWVHACAEIKSQWQRFVQTAAQDRLKVVLGTNVWVLVQVFNARGAVLIIFISIRERQWVFMSVCILLAFDSISLERDLQQFV